LQYSRLAIDAGKTAKQFMKDSDFDPYKEDPEFLDAIGFHGRKQGGQPRMASRPPSYAGTEQDSEDDDDDDFDIDF
jgi:hypothetical protein